VDKKQLFDTLDGLFAYDTGCTSGIHDVLLKEKVRTLLLSKSKEEQSVYPSVVDEFLRQSYYQSPYTLEDVGEFKEWLDELLSL
jgi:hypothetical protein